MDSILRGQAWKFGCNINTDVIFPQRYSYKTNPNEIAEHAMEGINPDFARDVNKGDIIVAGNNFGCGSSMEHAPIALKHAGVGAIVASSFARIFYRNAICLGLPVIQSTDAYKKTERGDRLEIETETGAIWNSVVAPKPKGLNAAVRIVRENLRRKILTFVNINNHFEGSAPISIERFTEELRHSQ